LRGKGALLGALPEAVLEVVGRAIALDRQIGRADPDPQPVGSFADR
jgi:hypothetical protein